MAKRNKKARPLTESAARDLDETRRLAYTLLAGVDQEDRELAGTLVNALVHHQGAAAVDEAMAQVRALLGNPENEAARLWMSRHVKRITDALGD
jgi:hypothetical protein